MQLSIKDKAVLDHVVVDPQGWADHALAYSIEQVAEERKRLDALNALIVSGAQIDPRQKQALEASLSVSAEERASGLVAAKVSRWKPDYLAKKDLPGYQSRVEREKP